MKLVVILCALAGLLVACGGEAAETPSAGPTSTTVASAATARPEPSATPQPTVEPTQEPTPEPPPPTEAPQSQPPPPRPDNVTLTVRAALIAFQPKTLTAPAGSRVTLVMQNEDRNVPHDIAVRIPGAAASTQCNGPCSVSITFTAPGPGSYQFYCPVHPTDMTGTLVVTP